MNMTTKQMQEKLLVWLDEREEMEIRIEDLGELIIVYIIHKHFLCLYLCVCLLCTHIM